MVPYAKVVSSRCTVGPLCCKQPQGHLDSRGATGHKIRPGNVIRELLQWHRVG